MTAPSEKVSPAPKQILVISSSSEGQVLTSLLSRSGSEPQLSTSVRDGLALLSRLPVSMIFCEDVLSDGRFNDVLSAVKSSGLQTPVILFSRLGDWKLYLEALSAGATDCIAPPFQFRYLERILHKAPVVVRPARGPSASDES